MKLIDLLLLLNLGRVRFVLSEHLLLLDLFHEKQIEELILKLENIKSETTWYIADFQLNRNTKYRLIRTIQLKATILFFRIATQHSIKHLPNIDTLFIQMKYAPKTETKGYPFIFCEVFKKQF